MGSYFSSSAAVVETENANSFSAKEEIVKAEVDFAAANPFLCAPPSLIDLDGVNEKGGSVVEMSLFSKLALPRPFHESSAAGSAPEGAEGGSGGLVIMEGGLRKQPTGLTKTINESRWKERYFVLQRGGLFYYQVDAEIPLPREFVIEHVGLVPSVGFKICITPRCNDNIILGNLEITKDQIVLAVSAAFTSLEKLCGKCVLVLQNTGSRVWGESWVEHFVTRNLISGTFVLQRRQQRGMFVLSDDRAEPGDFPTVVHVKGAAGRILTLDCGTEANAEKWLRAILGTKTIRSEVSNCAPTLEFYNQLHHILQKDPTPQKQLFSRSKSELYFILAIDGGGSRGIISCIILERLIKAFPDLMKNVSMLAGTSNGAMVAAGLACGHNVSTIRELIQVTSRAVFSEQQDRYSITKAKWSNRHLALLCKEIWGSKSMQDVDIPLVIPALLLDDKNDACRSMKIRVFSSIRQNQDVNILADGGVLAGSSQRGAESLAHEKGSRDTLRVGLRGADGPITLMDAVMRSCAAPTYFPSWQGYVDGGLFAHCPSDVALAEAVASGIPLERIFMISISTGHVSHHIKSPLDDDQHNFGLYQWVPQLTATLWETMIQKSVHQCQQMLGKRFFRVDPLLPYDIPLDDPARIPDMEQCGADFDIAECEAWIKNIFGRE